MWLDCLEMNVLKPLLFNRHFQTRLPIDWCHSRQPIWSPDRKSPSTEIGFHLDIFIAIKAAEVVNWMEKHTYSTTASEQLFPTIHLVV